MPPPIDDQLHAQLYSEIRAAVLSRHFAVGRYFWAHHLAPWNWLGSLHAFGSSAASDEDDRVLRCWQTEIARPSAYTDSASFLALTQPTQLYERWRVAFHDRENPHFYGSHLMCALAVECALGRAAEALPIIKQHLATLESLYKFRLSGLAHMDGYILRWDPVTSDHWSSRRRGRTIALDHACDFLRSARRTADGTWERIYLYCTPFNHPDYVPWTGLTAGPGRYLSQVRYRGWEPSQDEIVGLVLTYHLLFALVDDPEVRSTVRRHVQWLGDYLAEHAYLLVRPCGGFTARGASEGLPALEWIFDRTFGRITGETYASRSTFEQVMQLAGVWRVLQDRVVQNGAIGAVLGGAVLSPLGGLTGNVLGRAVGVWAAREGFDVWDDAQRAGFALSYLLMQLPPAARFDLLLGTQTTARGIELVATHLTRTPIRLSFGGHALAFPPYVCLTGLLANGAVDAAVRDRYRAWFPARLRSSPGKGGNTGFAAAVAVALGGAAADRAELRDWLDRSYQRLVGRWRWDLAIRERGSTNDTGEPSGLPPRYGAVTEEARQFDTDEDPDLVSHLDGLEYLACLALSWLAAALDRDPDGVIPRLPRAPLRFKRPSIPGVAIARGHAPAPTVGWRPGSQSFDIYRSPRGIGKPPDPPPPRGPAIVREDTYAVTVPENSALVEPDIVIHHADYVSLTPSGSIYAGVIATGWNGPEGWNWIDNDPKFPLKGSNPYALIYRLVKPDKELQPTPLGPMPMWVPMRPWTWLGEPLDFMWSGDTARLQFRTNDDSPGGGQGAFRCDVLIGCTRP
jgi:hypothetical protein